MCMRKREEHHPQGLVMPCSPSSSLPASWDLGMHLRILPVFSGWLGWGLEPRLACSFRLHSSVHRARESRPDYSNFKIGNSKVYEKILFTVGLVEPVFFSKCQRGMSSDSACVDLGFSTMCLCPYTHCCVYSMRAECGFFCFRWLALFCGTSST